MSHHDLMVNCCGHSSLQVLDSIRAHEVCSLSASWAYSNHDWLENKDIANDMSTLGHIVTTQSHLWRVLIAPIYIFCAMIQLLPGVPIKITWLVLRIIITGTEKRVWFPTHLPCWTLCCFTFPKMSRDHSQNRSRQWTGMSHAGIWWTSPLWHDLKFALRATPSCLLYLLWRYRVPIR